MNVRLRRLLYSRFYIVKMLVIFKNLLITDAFYDLNIGALLKLFKFLKVCEYKIIVSY